jgi:uncharacterized NAD-dependent epimerase/dehydratase family protein
MKQAAIILGDHLLYTPYGKTAHGLLRNSDRFSIVGVVEPERGSGDAGDLIGVAPVGIPLTRSVESAISAASERPSWAIIGIATPGGKMSATLRNLALSAATTGLSIVNGLHDHLVDDKDILTAARAHNAQIIDLRKAKKPSEMSYWTGRICKLPTVRIAVLGTDCIVGKRTTANMIVSGLRARGLASEMIYTGQTGWLQGADYGFILDATINDFISGEMESALLACARDTNPDVMVIEGQSSMQNPSTPCGAEIILSGDVHGVVLQHAPGRGAFSGFSSLLGKRPCLKTEVRIVAAYEKPLIGICLNFSEAKGLCKERYIEQLIDRYHVPVVAPLLEPIEPILDPISNLTRAVAAASEAASRRSMILGSRSDLPSNEKGALWTRRTLSQ